MRWKINIVKDKSASKLSILKIALFLEFSLIILLIFLFLLYLLDIF